MNLKNSIAIGALSAATLTYGQAAAQDVVLDEPIRVITHDVETTMPVITADTAAEAAKQMQAYAERRRAMVMEDRSTGRGLGLGQQDRSDQVVYLAFGDDEPGFDAFQGTFFFGTFDDYEYTPEDRDYIQSRLEADYAHYDFVFTQDIPADGPFTTIKIGNPDSNVLNLADGILFGRADNIDFGNDVRSDDAFVDATFWQFLAELDLRAGTQNLSNFLNIGVPLSAEEIDAARVSAIRNQSANTAAHELGHILGLRHHDSFGAPGDGLPPARSPGEFIPVVETDQNALETLQHIMASGASAGLSISSPPLIDRFFSERSATKLAINERTRSIDEAVTRRNGGKLTLNKVVGSNPLLAGENAGGKLDIRAALVDGSVSTLTEVDTYTFKAKAGEIFNAELISSSDRTVEDPIWGRLTLKRLLADGSVETLADNQLTFEGREPLLFDVTLPASGEYILEVSAPDLVPLASGAFVPLSAFGLNEFRTGDYEMLAYVVDGKPGGGRK